MNKFKLLIIMLCLVLVGCSAQENEDEHKDSKNHENSKVAIVKISITKK